MAYIINNSRGEVVAVVADGTINTTSTSLGLVGRGTTDYGAQENENYVFLLENFANDTAPTNPVLGQLWYNSDTDVLAAYDSAGVWGNIASQEYVQQQKINPIFTGIPEAPTASRGTATTQLATTAFVTNSPAFAGAPTAPTAPAGTANTQLATTSFVTNSPVFLGTPTAPTAPAGTANAQIATTAFVTNSPELAGAPTAPTAAVTDNTTRIATTEFVQLNKINPVFTGTPTAPTAVASDDSTQIATTAFVQSQKISPIFSGAPQAPTAAGGTSNTQIATTAWVVDATAGANSVLGTMALQNSANVFIQGGTITNITPLAVAFGGTGADTAPTARENLGLGSMATQNANAVSISGGTITDIAPLPVSSGGTGAGVPETARINLGLGSMSTQNATSVSITGGNISGITPLPVGSGGTGADTDAAARTNLGLRDMAIQQPDAVEITGGNISGASIGNAVITSLSEPLSVASGGTGFNSFATGELLVGNVGGLRKGTIIAGRAMEVNKSNGNFTLNYLGGTGVGNIVSIGLAAGSGISVAGAPVSSGSRTFTIENTGVTRLTGGPGVSISQPTGDVFINGIIGPPGPAGPTGPTGARGPTGPAGSSGGSTASLSRVVNGATGSVSFSSSGSGDFLWVISVYPFGSGSGSISYTFRFSSSQTFGTRNASGVNVLNPWTALGAFYSASTAEINWQASGGVTGASVNIGYVQVG